MKNEKCEIYDYVWVCFYSYDLAVINGEINIGIGDPRGFEGMLVYIFLEFPLLGWLFG